MTIHVVWQTSPDTTSYADKLKVLHRIHEIFQPELGGGGWADRKQPLYNGRTVHTNWIILCH